MLKAGFSRVDVTPPLGTFVAGDFSERYSKTVLDPIYLNALALEEKGVKAVIVACDFLMISMKYATPIRELISKRTNIPVDNIMLCALHQHSSIHIRDSKYNNVLTDHTYLDVLYRKFGDVVQMALNDLKEATLSVGIRETDEKIAFIRRYYMKNGAIETNPIGRYKEVERPYYDADNNVRLLKFERKDGKDIAFINFSTHADVIHKHLNSADWPGFARKFVEEDIENVHCILTVGAQGDSNHCDFTAPTYKDGYEHCRHMGRVIADTVIKMWNDTIPKKTDYLNSQVEILYNKTRLDGEDKVKEAKKLLDDHYSGRVKDIDYTLIGNATRIVNLKDQPIFQKIPVTVINLGEIGFVGFGGEPFTRYAELIRKATPDRFVIVSCCTNGGEGYLPIKEAFKEGGYESGCSNFSPNLEEDSVEMAVKLLNKKGV